MMTIGQVGKISPSSFIYANSNINLTSTRRRKTHDYTQLECNIDYVFEAIGMGVQAYMTAQGKGIKQGDFIILKVGTTVDRYEVEKVDYYLSPADMWIALLTRTAKCM